MLEQGPLLKVCGVTNPADAIMCAERGVQMIGLNFACESQRYVEREAAAEIIRAVRAASRAVRFVGVFVNEQLELVSSLAQELTLDAIQLHGNESPEYARALRPMFLIKAFRVGPQYDESLAANYPSNAILLDSWNAKFRGGTGETFDWSVARSLRPRVSQLILAGGLTAHNVRAAIPVVRPYAIDVCSGVEDSPGRKSREKLCALLEALRETPAISP
ncbi:MAG: N-(5'-phosphoribosyl)anthranilate isomerase [Chthoniobacterales bacterium]|nr:MAG: N-(5'-phosphoribosyl)anthranilate isomerase [Chthoniobacterales bacterium]